MNKEQFEYDTLVQYNNRANDIELLESKLNRLIAARDDILNIAKHDKIDNKRRETLKIYKQQIAEQDKKIKFTGNLVKSMKIKNGLLPRKKYNRSNHDSNDQLNNLHQIYLSESDVENITPAARFWLLRNYQENHQVNNDISDSKHATINANKIINNDSNSPTDISDYCPDSDDESAIVSILEEVDHEIESTKKKMEEQRLCCI